MVMSITLLVVFMLLMFLGVPIAISLGAASVFTIVTMSSLPLSMAAQSMFTSMNSFIMVAVPLFILCGSLMDEGELRIRFMIWLSPWLAGFSEAWAMYLLW